MCWGEAEAGERSRPWAMRAVYRCRSGIGLTPVCTAVLLGITDVSCPILPIIKITMGAGKACQVLAGSPGGYEARDNRNRRDRACTVKDGKRLTLSSVLSMWSAGTPTCAPLGGDTGKLVALGIQRCGRKEMTNVQ